MKKSIAVVVHN